MNSHLQMVTEHVCADSYIFGNAAHEALPDTATICIE